MRFFENNFIFCSNNDQLCINDQFINIGRYYENRLSVSIDDLEKTKKLKIYEHKFYNYILLEAEPLEKLIEHIKSRAGVVTNIDNVIFKDIDFYITVNDLVFFKTIIIYIGKGCLNRKFSHFKDCLKHISGFEHKSKERISRIVDIWENNEGVGLLEIENNSNHYIACCRESSMIKSAGNHLTNQINGAKYGDMKTNWTLNDMKLFGDMLLYFALKKCIISMPDIISPRKMTT